MCNAKVTDISVFMKQCLQPPLQNNGNVFTCKVSPFVGAVKEMPRLIHQSPWSIGWRFIACFFRCLWNLRTFLHISEEDWLQIIRYLFRCRIQNLFEYTDLSLGSWDFRCLKTYSASVVKCIQSWWKSWKLDIVIIFDNRFVLGTLLKSLPGSSSTSTWGWISFSPHIEQITGRRSLRCESLFLSQFTSNLNQT